MSLSLFIARRIYRESDGGKQVSRPAVLIAMAGIAIGLAVMIIAVAVVIGFKSEVRNKVIGFGSHIHRLPPFTRLKMSRGTGGSQSRPLSSASLSLISQP